MSRAADTLLATGASSAPTSVSAWLPAGGCSSSSPKGLCRDDRLAHLPERLQGLGFAHGRLGPGDGRAGHRRRLGGDGVEHQCGQPGRRRARGFRSPAQRPGGGRLGHRAGLRGGAGPGRRAAVVSGRSASRRRERRSGAVDEHPDGGRPGPGSQPGPDLRARRLRRRGGDEGAAPGHGRDALQRQRAAGGRARAEDLRPRPRPHGDGPGLRHRHRQRRAARVRQRRAARPDRSGRRLRHREPRRSRSGSTSSDRGSPRRSAPAVTTSSTTIGGISMLHGLAALDEDPATKVIVLVSKPPRPTVAAAVLDRGRGERQARRRHLPRRRPGDDHATTASTARPTWPRRADMAVALAKGEQAAAAAPSRCPSEMRRRLIERPRARMAPSQRYVRGIFSGGTFCFEAQLIHAAAGITAFSNTPTAGQLAAGETPGQARRTPSSTWVTTQFTQGRPHPMIDPTLRDARIREEVADPDDRRGALRRRARLRLVATTRWPDCSASSARPRPAAKAAGRHGRVHRLRVRDRPGPQNRAKVIAGLKAAGVLVASSNAEAAAWSAAVDRTQGRACTGKGHREVALRQDLKVVNVGLQGFADNITAAGGDGHPPELGAARRAPTPPWAGRSPAWSAIPRIEEANRKAYERYLAAQPRLVDLVLAARPSPASPTGERRILHSGPPIDVGRHVRPAAGRHHRRDPLRGLGRLAGRRGGARGQRAGRRSTRATSTARSGRWPGSSARRCRCGSWRTPTHGNRAYCNLNEGLGKVLRFGRIRPRCSTGCAGSAPSSSPSCRPRCAAWTDPDLKPLMAQALHMGDELHNRNAAASALLFKRLTLALLGSDARPRRRSSGRCAFVAGNDHFFLNISMAACKSMSDAAHGVPGSSMVTVMARNGVNFGIRLSGTGDQWFQAPANPVDGLYFPGYSRRGRRAPTSGTRPSPRPTASAASPWPPRRPSCSSSAARRPTPPPTAAGCSSITLGTQPGVHAAGAELRRHARRNRRPPGRRLRNPADHQHGHRAQEGRRRPDRRRHHHRADGVLQRRHRARWPPRLPACRRRRES